MKTDILVVGSGCAALYFALQAPENLNLCLITKEDVESSDSYLAQGGICVLKDPSDYQTFYEDTLHAGHQENNPDSVRIMIESSPDVIRDLVQYGVDFAREPDGSFAYTREGAHRTARILYHEDITGKEITSHLLQAVRNKPNVQIYEYTALLDLLIHEGKCVGAIVSHADGKLDRVFANETVLATGGIGGLFAHSTNFPHLTGVAVGLALRHGIKTQQVNYIQVHPTTLYSKEKEERAFLISESVRGEGAHLYNKAGERFVNELLPRDALAQAIVTQMEKDQSEFVWEDLRPIPRSVLSRHFPNIVKTCKEAGYDVFAEPIPVVPAQHYFMGGVWVDSVSHTSMENLYAIGECACNGVHGRNRLASNSLLESLVFAKRAAKDVARRASRRKSKEVPLSETLVDAEKLPWHPDRVYENPVDFQRETERLVVRKIEALGGSSSVDVPYREDL